MRGEELRGGGSEREEVRGGERQGGRQQGEEGDEEEGRRGGGGKFESNDFVNLSHNRPSMFSLGGQLVVATGCGVLHRLTWEGKMISSMAIHLNQVPFATDLLPSSQGQWVGGWGGERGRVPVV